MWHPNGKSCIFGQRNVLSESHFLPAMYPAEKVALCKDALALQAQVSVLCKLPETIHPNTSDDARHRWQPPASDTFDLSAGESRPSSLIPKADNKTLMRRQHEIRTF